jgi:hypothetical protein
MNERQARAVTLVQAFESAPEGPLWTAEDRRWATRAARESLPGDDVDLAHFVAERARMALQRLAPRDANVRRALAARAPTGVVLAAALALGALLGVLSDSLVAGAYFNLLSLPFWGVLAWNAVVYALLVVWALRRAPPGPLRRALARALRRGVRALGRGGPLADFAARWSTLSMPLQVQRGTLALHLFAGGVALGLIGGLVLRGLVFDYRAGWASTLLDPPAVRHALAWGLAPATAATGIAVPDAATFEALRVSPTSPASASAAPWLWLMAAELLLLVVLPRALLAAAAAWRLGRLARAFPLPLDGPYFERLRPAPAAAGLWVLPHAEAPSPGAVLGLRTLLARLWGEQAPLQIAPPVAYGDESEPPSPPAGWRAIVLVDLAATPEPDVHGRLLDAVASRAPGARLLIADSGAFRRRFGPGARLDERAAGWRALAQAHGTAFLAWPLEALASPAGRDAEVDAAADALRAALEPA